MDARFAVCRGISDRFSEALVREPSAGPPDVERARRQHAAYVDALRQAGCEVVLLPPLDGHPDCCFVEDCAVVAQGVALATRPGALSRRSEVPSVREILSRWLRVADMPAPATLDGGDCLRIGRTIFVGRSERTNAEGAARLREVFGALGLDVREVEVPDALHLKCVCSALDDRRVVLAEGTVPAETFAGFEVLRVPFEERLAANVLSVNGVALVADGFPETRRVVAAAGLRVVTLETTEIAKADGALTCMSVLV